MTRTKAAQPSRPQLLRLAQCLVAASLVALAAQISVAMVPVPMTLQSLAVSLAGMWLGARGGALAILVYLAAGALGLPVFAGGASGLAHLFGPTCGYLWGFVGMAWLTGRLVESGFSGRLGPLLVAAILPGILLFFPGVIGLLLTTDEGLTHALAVGVTPLLPGAVLKTAIAAVLVRLMRPAFAAPDR